jgi:hypothetical protein
MIEMTKLFHTEQLLLIKCIKKSQKKKQNETMLKAMEKMGKHKKLKSKEFLEVYQLLWREGPKIKYGNPEKWERVTRDFGTFQ